ncbi:hypothetical protein AO398_19990 [Methylobacterium sp. GXS13]|jgi:hypothetical protein|uniref:hypothetical protein n=1 Tax=Methylobacterium sp. GXS13 TaxID=1730094 RepID=UPI00071B9227|nr:hypothetical protein [Methylobacterium sp. GXS13]KST58892.1 hypothetical protein AO398_19990 [Methylobacterium sp. GXS13]
MSVRQICDQVRVTERAFTAALGAMKATGLREELTRELQEMEAAEIEAGQDETSARSASWKRVKMLHGLGYPVDFGWLHLASRAAPVRSA